MDRPERGRALLAEWAATGPENVFADDPYLRFALTCRIPADQLCRLTPAPLQVGADSAGPLDRATAELDRPEHLPRLEAWSAVGERSDEIRFHPSHHAAGRLDRDLHPGYDALEDAGYPARIARLIET